MQAAERAAWLRLITTPGLGPRAARRLLSEFGLPQAIFDAGLSTLLRSMPEPLARVLAQPPSSEARSAIDATEHWLAAAPDHALLTLADSAYPQALLATADPPLVLFAIGRVELLNRPSLAIVGSRNATRQGSENAQLFARALAQAGITVASGLALGIDAAAHRGALAADSDASTIAVVGTGVDVTYPASNRTLTNDIRKRGVVVSEFTLRTPAIAHNFPRRNRIIAGITRGTLGRRSGVALGLADHRPIGRRQRPRSVRRAGLDSLAVVQGLPPADTRRRQAGRICSGRTRRNRFGAPRRCSCRRCPG